MEANREMIKIYVYIYSFFKFLTRWLNYIAIVLEDQAFKVAGSVRDRRWPTTLHE